jgi:hypothetical protein
MYGTLLEHLFGAKGWIAWHLLERLKGVFGVLID